jgi:hypothetical protein
MVRTAMQEQVEGFAVETSAVPNHGLILELDQVGDQLDRRYLHGPSMSPLSSPGWSSTRTGRTACAGCA